MTPPARGTLLERFITISKASTCPNERCAMRYVIFSRPLTWTAESFVKQRI